MARKHRFEREVYIRLTDEADGFLSTVSYSILRTKKLHFRFKRVAQFMTGKEAGNVQSRPRIADRSIPKS